MPNENENALVSTVSDNGGRTQEPGLREGRSPVPSAWSESMQNGFLVSVDQHQGLLVERERQGEFQGFRPRQKGQPGFPL